MPEYPTLRLFGLLYAPPTFQCFIYNIMSAQEPIDIDAPIPQPLSPCSVKAILALSPDKTTLEDIINGLLATIEKNRQEHNIHAATLQADIYNLESKLQNYELAATDIPKGYQPNNGRFTSLIIPDKHGNHTVAKYIRRHPTDPLQILGTNGGPPGEPLTVVSQELFAMPQNDLDEIAKPIPYWFLTQIASTSSIIDRVVQATAQLEDWGLEADINQYHNNKVKLACLQLQEDAIRLEIEGHEDCHNQIRYRLQTARAATRLAILNTTGGRAIGATGICTTCPHFHPARGCAT
jgi:hypothetical protein